MTVSAGDTDEQLASTARDGDRAAFDRLVHRHKEPLYRFVRRYIGNRDDAYDVLQNCFVAAWTGLPRYDAARPFLPWLRTIALNKCRDFGRRQKVRRFFLSAFARENPAEPSTEHQQDIQRDSAKNERTLERLDAAIASLPEFYKEPLLLTSVSGLSQAEAADILKTTPKAIEMRLRRARQKLVAAIAHLDGEG